MNMRIASWLLVAALLGAYAVAPSAGQEQDRPHTRWQAAWFTPPTPTCNATVSCPSGQYAETTTCKNCPIMTFKAADGPGCCEACSLPRLTNNVTGATACFTPECPAGTYTNQTGTGVLDRCIPCSGNTSYSATKGATACSTCPTGTVANLLHTGCVAVTTLCPAGTLQWRGSCKPCPRATVTGPTPGSPCLPCPLGQFSTDGVTCNTCYQGYFNTGNAAAPNCTSCAAGYYKALGAKAARASTKSLITPTSIVCLKCRSGLASPDNNVWTKCCASGKTWNGSACV